MPTSIQLDSSSPLAEALASAFEAYLREARHHANQAIDSPHTSLRGYRQALRRADALLDLCAPCLRERQGLWLRDSIASARRRTRLLRDLDAVGAVVEDLAELEAPAASGENAEDEARPAEARSNRYDGVRTLITAFKAELATTELVAWRLRKNLRSLAGLSSVFRAALGWVDEGVLLESLRASYRDARRAMRRAARKGTAPAINAFRMQARTLFHQLTLLASAPKASDELKAAAETLGHIVTQLRGLTDIFALRLMIISADKATLGQSPKKLAAKLDDLARSRTDEIFSLAGTIFAGRPSDFLSAQETSDLGRADSEQQLRDEDHFQPASFEQQLDDLDD